MRQAQKIPWGIVGAVASTISLIALVYYYNYRKDFSGERGRILKERRMLQEDLGPDYGALRAKIEAWTSKSATKPYPGDLVDPEAKNLGWRERPSIYLRLRVEDAKTLDSVHTLSKLGILDGLSACLLRVKGNYGPWAWGDIVARAEMLGSDFTNDVRDTSNDLRLRNLAYALDHYKNEDFPKARDGVRMSEYFVLALDEDPATIPETSAVFGADASVEQKIASVAHPIRLQLWRLSDGKELLRVRRTPDAQVIQVQGDSFVPGAGVELRRMQALSCELANVALEAVGVAGGPAMAASGSPLPVALPTAVPSGSATAAPSGSASGAPSTSAAPSGSSSAPP
jgi:hypothetical protein